ncbi:MAG: hypothetical protein AUK47_00730 [Deltaproteobacteria bacterium CG2_30_63_29]|nr:MAG: hypothetical protein AUK47_00730 [Deltaproteobacteria bacterium CG2_30_63_29]PJB38025.1 MAG: amidase [Deltaproteobacteria bacterium CG_4_9_14_3_um_filter_63_12]
MQDLHTLPAHLLLKHLESGELTSVQLVEALNKRRETLDGRLRSFILVRKEALSEAKAADEAREQGVSWGPLHGLPVTIKENLDLAGTDSTLGLRSRVGTPATADAVLVKALKDAGAIILGKTNVPQLLLAQETENAVFGVTNNPWKLNHVPGGSSGGEAAAIAAGLSPLGLGTDIGGSIRVPAHFCGLVGFKPTLDRWSNRGSRGAIMGQELVRSQIGALARETRDIMLLWSTLDPCAQARVDPWVAPLPAADPEAVDLTGMRIGYFDDDPFLEPTASLKRAVQRTKEVLEKAGATLVPHKSVPSEDIVYLWLGAISSDGGRTIDAKLAGEAISPQLKASRQALKIPALGRKVIAKIMATRGEHRLSRLLEVLGEKRVDEVWELTARRSDLKRQELDAWNRNDIDALLCPPHVVAALPHRESGDFTLSVVSEFRWTLLNFPAGVIPVTKVRANEVGRYPYAKGDRVQRKVAAMEALSVGLPVGVQIVARPYAEDRLLAVMCAVQDGVRDDEDYPVTPVSV